MQTLDELFDLRVDERLAAADRDHRCVALHRRGKAILQRQQIFQGSGILTNPSAPGARKIAGVQRFELQDSGKLFRPTNFVADDVGGNLCREGERKSHKCGILTSVLSLSMEGHSVDGDSTTEGIVSTSIPKWH